MGRLGIRLRRYAERDGRGYPDWATRYVPIVRRLRPRLASDSVIIEIGANANGLARFMEGSIIAVDINREHLLEARSADPERVFPVLADAAALPFADNAANGIASVDLFEHLPETLREPVGHEIARILAIDGTAVVAFPSGAASAHAERAIAEEYALLTCRMLPWLVQHAALGLPDADTVAQTFEKCLGTTHTITSTPNTSLVVWRWMWRVLLCGWPGRGNAVFQALLRFLTPVLCRLHGGVCYRRILWMEPKPK